MALSGLVSFLCKSLFISQSTVNNRGSVASDLVLAKLLSKDNFFAVNSFPILSLGSFEDEALVTILRASGEATIPVKKSKRTKAQAKALPVIHPRETVVDLFGPESEESEDDGERTQHIEGPNPENEHGTTCVAAAGDSASPSNSGQSDAAAEPATPLIPDVNDVLLPLHLNTEDVNVMKDGENADDYESFGSEADGSGSSDDERIERRQTGDEVLAEHAALDGVVTCIFRVRARRARVPGDE
ncbi:hypothetical protein PC121_g21175 [Phytophthora cactorum]|nr:hypothetical protein PC121_g21175 [Phytophthora cactorum]